MPSAARFTREIGNMSTNPVNKLSTPEPRGRSIPTQRTQARLRERGYEVANCERKVPISGRGFKGRLVTQDLFGFIDTLAMHKEEWKRLLAIQSTDDSHHATRRAKIKANPLVKLWLRQCALEIWSWGKKGGRGQRKLWTLRRERVVLDSEGKVAFEPPNDTM